ncbi:hypothetical protein PMAYCL1PPCAC_21555, partial [Pristionchus mayeri]
SRYARIIEYTAFALRMIAEAYLLCTFSYVRTCLSAKYRSTVMFTSKLYSDTNIHIRIMDITTIISSAIESYLITPVSIRMSGNRRMMK